MGNFLLGLGVGLIGGCLFAPKAGRDSRDYIRHRAEEGAGYVKDRAGDLVERGKSTLHRESATESGTMHPAFQGNESPYPR